MVSIIMEITHPPFGRENTYAALFIASASVALGIEVTIALTGEGVYSGLKGQTDPQKNINMPSTEGQIKDFLFLGGTVVVDERSMVTRGIRETELIEGIKVLDRSAVVDLILAKGEHVLVF
jgi:predicted peroxiredoxin